MMPRTGKKPYDKSGKKGGGMFGKKTKPSKFAVLVSPDGKSKIGLLPRFNWSLFLSSSVFGFPLLRLRLWDWAAGMFVLSSADIWLSVKKLMATWDAALSGDLAALDRMEESCAEHFLSGLLLAGSIWLGFYGHRLCCRRLMQKGWRFENPDDPASSAAIKKWRIPPQYSKKYGEHKRIRLRTGTPSDRL